MKILVSTVPMKRFPFFLFCEVFFFFAPVSLLPSNSLLYAEELFDSRFLY